MSVYKQISAMCDQGMLPQFSGLPTKSVARKVAAALHQTVQNKALSVESFKDFVYYLTNGMIEGFDDDVAFKICKEISPYELLKILTQNNLEINEGVFLSIPEEVKALKDFNGVFIQFFKVVFQGESEYSKLIQGMDNAEQLWLFREMCNQIYEQTNYGIVSNTYEADEDTILTWLKGNDFLEWLTEKKTFSFKEYCTHFCISEDFFMGTDAHTIIENILSIIAYRAEERIGTFSSCMDELYQDLQDIVVDDITAISQPVKLNLLLQGEYEFTSGFTIIHQLNGILSGRIELSRADLEQNALTWLIYQQGYTLQDLVTNTNSIFLQSVREELQNISDDINILTIACTASVKDMEVAGLNAGAVKQPLKFSKDVTIGLFDPQRGTGSLMCIALEKPLIIPQEMIFDIQIEDAKNNEYSHTIDSTFKDIDNPWETTLEVATRNEQPLLKVNIEKDLNWLMEYQASQEQRPS